jgi:hypothetical protein
MVLSQCEQWVVCHEGVNVGNRSYGEQCVTCIMGTCVN